MKLTPPERGSVIRYAYLWANEHNRGQEDARKDRPSLVVALSVHREDGNTEVLALAITHTRLFDTSQAIILPADVKKHLGLDTEPSWIVTTEANAFIWPGPDIRPIPGRKPSAFVYGRIPDGLLSKVAQSFLANRNRQRAAMIVRN